MYLAQAFSNETLLDAEVVTLHVLTSRPSVYYKKEPSLQSKQTITEACCIQLAIGFLLAMSFLLATKVHDNAANSAAQQ